MSPNLENRTTLRVEELWRNASSWHSSLERKHQITLWSSVTFLGLVGVLFLIFHQWVFGMLVKISEEWRQLPYGGVLLFGLICCVSFPPLIGYSALSSLVGMVYGFPKGWPFLALATLVGSTLSFVMFRYVFSDYGHRLAERNTKFAALTKTLEQDRFTLLWMIRLCPLPYSLSNGALSSIPSVSLWRFMAATALTSPKLLGHIFVGDRLARLGSEKDLTTKIVDLVSVLLAVTVGTATAYIIYNRTMERASLMEAAREYTELDETSADGDDEFELWEEDENEYSMREHH